MLGWIEVEFGFLQLSLFRCKYAILYTDIYHNSLQNLWNRSDGGLNIYQKCLKIKNVLGGGESTLIWTNFLLAFVDLFLILYASYINGIFFLFPPVRLEYQTDLTDAYGS